MPFYCHRFVLYAKALQNVNFHGLQGFFDAFQATVDKCVPHKLQ